MVYIKVVVLTTTYNFVVEKFQNLEFLNGIEYSYS